MACPFRPVSNNRGTGDSLGKVIFQGCRVVLDGLARDQLPLVGATKIFQDYFPQMRIRAVIDDQSAVGRRKETIDIGVNGRQVELIHVLKVPSDAIQRVACMSAVYGDRLRWQSLHFSQGCRQSAEGCENA